MKRPAAPDRAGKMNGSATVVLGRDITVERFFGGNSSLSSGRETDETLLEICVRYLAFMGGSVKTASGTGKRR